MPDDTLILEVRDGAATFTRNLDPEDFLATPQEGSYIRPILQQDDSLRENERFKAMNGTFRVRAVVHDCCEGRLVILAEFGTPNSVSL